MSMWGVLAVELFYTELSKVGCLAGTDIFFLGGGGVCNNLIMRLWIILHYYTPYISFLFIQRRLIPSF